MRETWRIQDAQQAATREAEPAEGGLKQEARTQQSSYGIQNEVETFFSRKYVESQRFTYAVIIYLV